MKWLILFLLMIGFSSGCVDINSATLDELDEIIWVGPATAQKIIDTRPFNDLSDLRKVHGIGDVKFEDIKNEGLACVGEGSEEDTEASMVDIIDTLEDNVAERVIPQEKAPEVLFLNNKSDVGELVYISKDARVIEWLPYGFALFLIFIIGILLIDKF